MRDGDRRHRCHRPGGQAHGGNQLRAGLIALLVALDGYLIAFSRVMHYESVVVLQLIAGVVAHAAHSPAYPAGAAVADSGELYLLAAGGYRRCRPL